MELRQEVVAEIMQRLGLEKQVPAPLQPYATPPSAVDARQREDLLRVVVARERTMKAVPASRWRRGEPQRNGDAYVTAPRTNDESERVNQVPNAPRLLLDEKVFRPGSGLSSLSTHAPPERRCQGTPVSGGCVWVGRGSS